MSVPPKFLLFSRRRYLTVLLFLLSVVSVQAQTPDTLRPNSFADSCAMRFEPSLSRNIPDLALYIDLGGGYIAGNSVLGFMAKAQKFYGGGLMTHVAFLFGGKEQSANPGNISAIVYEVNPATGAPGAQIAETLPLPVDEIIASSVDLDSASKLTVLSFFEPVTVPDTFFVGLSLLNLAPGDTIGLWSTKDGCFSGDQLAWEQAANSNWRPFNDGTPASWRLDIDMAIFPIGDFGLTSIADLEFKNVAQCYPNPATKEVFFELPFSNVRSATLKIFNTSGKLIAEEMVVLTDDYFSYNVKQLLKGTYLYQISKDKLTLATGKFLVER